MSTPLVPTGLGALLAELNADDLEYVVIGGVAVNLLGRQRMTRDVAVLVPATVEQGAAIAALLGRLRATRPEGSELPDALFDGEHHIRALTAHGLIDFIPEGDGPLSYEAVRGSARPAALHGVTIWRASLATIVALKRLADRPLDREDLAALELAYGPLPELT